MEPTVYVKGGLVIVLTSMTSGRTGGGTGEHKLPSWLGSVLTANSVTGLGGEAPKSQQRMSDDGCRKQDES